MSKLRSVAIGLTAGCMVFHATGCAANTQGTSAALGVDARDLRVGQAEIGRLTDIDRENQVVIIEEADGDRSAVAVASHIVLGRMEVGDKVRVESRGLLGFELLEPGQSIDDEAFSDEALPAGVTFGRKISTTVEILKVSDHGRRGIVLSKDGAVRELQVGSKAERQLLARLRPGDEVTASCTEKLRIKLER